MNDLFQFDMKVKLKMIVINVEAVYIFTIKVIKDHLRIFRVYTTQRNPNHWMQFLCCLSLQRHDEFLCVMSQINAVCASHPFWFSFHFENEKNNSRISVGADSRFFVVFAFCCLL